MTTGEMAEMLIKVHKQSIEDDCTVGEVLAWLQFIDNDLGEDALEEIKEFLDDRLERGNWEGLADCGAAMHT